MSLRERKKLATRAALIAAARRLFVKRGYDNVTLEDICAAVPIHTNTFFAYFGSKEELAFAYQLDALAAFRELIKARPPQSDVVSLWWDFNDTYDLKKRGEESTILSQMDHVPSLRNRQANIVRQYVETIADTLADDLGGRLSDELYASLYASAMMAVYMAGARWFTAKFGREIESSDTAAFARLIMARFPSPDELEAELARIRRTARTRKAKGEAKKAGAKSASAPRASKAPTTMEPEAPRAPKRNSPRAGRSPRPRIQKVE
jgi:AcrR family transcriptional regulator